MTRGPERPDGPPRGAPHRPTTLRPAVRPAVVDGARGLAAAALARVLDEGAWAQPALSLALDGSTLSDRDKGLATELFYGALRFAKPLEASILRAATKPGRGLDSRIRPHLLIAAYQLQHLADRIPAHAAVSSAVAAIKRERPGLEGFANALLRHLGSPMAAMLTTSSTLEERCAAWGVPFALGRAITLGLPVEEHDAAIAGLQARPETWAIYFSSTEPPEGLVAHPFVPRLFTLPGGRVDAVAGFAEGQFLVVDGGSALSALALAPAPGARVIDLCAAPGGKSMIIADAVGQTGHVVAVELQPRRAGRITENAERLGLEMRVIVKIGDATTMELEPADAVLLDAPCTGLGTTRRKPEIAHRFDEAAMPAVTTLQASLFDAAARLVKPGGVLVYSVCSPLPAEGRGQVKAFLHRHPDFERTPIGDILPFVPASALDEDGQLRLLPHAHGTDAFFVARLRRKTVDL